MSREMWVYEEKRSSEDEESDRDGSLRLERRRRTSAERIHFRRRTKPDLNRLKNWCEPVKKLVLTGLHYFVKQNQIWTETTVSELTVAHWPLNL